MEGTLWFLSFAISSLRFWMVDLRLSRCFINCFLWH